MRGPRCFWSGARCKHTAAAAVEMVCFNIRSGVLVALAHGQIITKHGLLWCCPSYAVVIASVKLLNSQLGSLSSEKPEGQQQFVSLTWLAFYDDVGYIVIASCLHILFTYTIHNKTTFYTLYTYLMLPRLLCVTTTTTPMTTTTTTINGADDAYVPTDTLRDLVSKGPKVLHACACAH